GPDRLSRGAAQWRIITLSHGGRYRRIGECRRVEPLIHIVLPGGETLSRHHQGVASQPCSGGDTTRDSERLAVFECQRPVCHPTAYYGIQRTVMGREVTSLAEWQFVLSAEMKDIAHVVTTQGVVCLHTKTSQVRSAD